MKSFVFFLALALTICFFSVCRSQSKQDYYEIMGVKHNASTNKLFKQYGRLYKQYHPYYNVDDRAGAAKKMLLLNEAFYILKNKERRSLYDMYGLDSLKSAGLLYPQNDTLVWPRYKGYALNTYSFRKAVYGYLTYPGQDKKYRHEGDVTVVFTISEDGSLSDIKIGQTCQYDNLNQAALEAIKKLFSREQKYIIPAYDIKGNPIKTEIKFKFYFRLDKNKQYGINPPASARRLDNKARDDWKRMEDEHRAQYEYNEHIGMILH